MPQGAIATRVVNSAAFGNSFFVDETTGADTNSGSSASPFATLTAALAAATENNNDVIYLVGTVHISATLAWNKSGVHLVGLTAPSANCRARISQTGSTVFSPLVLVTGSGCSFVNLGTFHGFNSATAQICWKDSGGRNFYSGVQFLGMGNTTAAAQAGGRSLVVDGSNGENVFMGCTVGLDTVVRATGNNASLELTGATPRNRFENCLFQADVSNAADLHVLVGSGGIDRYALFKDCTFMNAINSGGSSMTVAFTVNASAGGFVLLDDPTSVGATVYATTGPIYVNGVSPVGNTAGLAVAAT